MTDPTFAGYQRRLRSPDSDDLRLREWGSWNSCTEEQAEFARVYGCPRGFPQVEAEVRPIFTNGDAALHALRLYKIYEAMPQDRGGPDGPKGRAYRAFTFAKHEALK